MSRRGAGIDEHGHAAVRCGARAVRRRSHCPPPDKRTTNAICPRVPPEVRAAEYIPLHGSTGTLGPARTCKASVFVDPRAVGSPIPTSCCPTASSSPVHYVRTRGLAHALQLDIGERRPDRARRAHRAALIQILIREPLNGLPRLLLLRAPSRVSAGAESPRTTPPSRSKSKAGLIRHKFEGQGKFHALERILRCRSRSWVLSTTGELSSAKRSTPLFRR